MLRGFVPAGAVSDAAMQSATAINSAGMILREWVLRFFIFGFLLFVVLGLL
jgi:hypothetical protein